MFAYENLSPNRRLFIDNAIKLYPDIEATKVINRQQIQSVVDHYNINYPQWFTVSGNSETRGVFKFPVPVHSVSYTDDSSTVESDEDIEKRIAERYEALSIIVSAIAEGKSKSVVISGGAGLGKSHTVKSILEDYDVDYQHVTGYVRPTGLFRLLYDNRYSGSVLVFDDADSIFADAVSLNLLKSALELKETKKINWLSEKRFVDDDGEDIPRYFDYSGSIIFISNIDFNHIIDKQTAMAPHLSAIVSRSLYLDIGIKTQREYIVKIKQTVRDTDIVTKYGLDDDEQESLLEYIESNAGRFRELSLRMVEKCATIFNIDQDNWRKLVESTCFR